MRWLLLMLCLPFLAPAFAAERAALVIGNWAYEKGRLVNPENDAKAVAAALLGLRFDVTVATNLDRDTMLEALDGFRTKIQPGGLALVYYSGHGVEVGGENWLLPVRNGAIGTQAQVRIRSVSARDVLQTLEEGGARLNLLVLDACRDNPLPAGARTASRGLVPISTGSSTLVAYSTSPGMTASDGSGNNSPYTAALVRVLKQTDVQIPDLFNQVGAEVLRSTGGAQVPWNSNTPIWPPIQLAGGASAIPSPLPEGGALGELRIEVSPADAQVYIDGALVGEGSQTLRSLPANTTREVEARRSGYQPHAIRAYIKAGEATSVRLALGPLVAAEPKPAPATAAVSPPAGPLSAASLPAAPAAGQPYRRPLRSGGEGPEMVVLPGGRFVMGSPEREEGRYPDEGPQRDVTVRSFAMGVTEVTFADWDRCVSAGGCKQRPEDEGWRRGNRPVINVSWDDAQEYARWLSGETGRKYRLPSEAEWEYAARGGTSSAYWWGNEIGRNRANCVGCESRWDNKQTAPVKSFAANPFGLYDTAGNVWEWVSDCYKDSYQGAPSDGRSVEASGCEMRVLRGASWYSRPSWLRSALRLGNGPSSRSDSIGFRLAEDL